MKRLQKVKTGVLYALLCVVLWGCGESVRDRYDRWMTELECPVILMGKTEKAVSYPAITVIDGAGRVRTMQAYDGGMSSHNCSSLPASIADSREIGDTLKVCDK